ncbi:MAG TPA: hypothetical protein V6C71_15975 [Coleofasciculaceae cyanobacterium]|jgi:hypothetical protein
MSTKSKFVANYNVYLDLEEDNVLICDRYRKHNLVLGKPTEKGIKRNRDVTEEQSRAISLCYSIAERHFSSIDCHSIDRTTAKLTKDELWLELNNREVRLYPLIGDKYLTIGWVSENGIANNHRTNDELYRHDTLVFCDKYLKIAERYFCPQVKKWQKLQRDRQN